MSFDNEIKAIEVQDPDTDQSELVTYQKDSEHNDWDGDFGDEDDFSS